jgi:hypothetical protein
MTRPLKLLGIGVPLMLAIGTVAYEFVKGAPHLVTLAVAASAAACLGLSVVFLLRSMLLLSGDDSASGSSVGRRRRAVEADISALARTLEGIELDQGIGRVSSSEAAELAAPLRDRVAILEREAELLRGLELEGVDGEIEAEVRERVAARAEGDS